MSNQKDYYVYMYLRVDGTPYYVGRGKKHRAFAKHCRGKRCFTPKDRNRIKIVRKHMSLLESRVAEKSLIRRYGRKEHGGILINIKPGGEDIAVWTPDMRKRMSIISSKRKFSEKTRQKMSASHTGKTRSTKAIEKMVSTRRQRDNFIPSKETRNKMSNSKKGIPAAWTQNTEQKKIIGNKISESKKGVFVGDADNLSKIQSNRILVFNTKTEKRYWIEKESDLSENEIPASLKTAIDRYNTGKKVATTGIKKKDLPTMCDKYNVKHMLKDVVE